MNVGICVNAECRKCIIAVNQKVILVDESETGEDFQSDKLYC